MLPEQEQRWGCCLRLREHLQVLVDLQLHLRERYCLTLLHDDYCGEAFIIVSQKFLLSIEGFGASEDAQHDEGE